MMCSASIYLITTGNIAEEPQASYYRVQRCLITAQRLSDIAYRHKQATPLKRYSCSFKQKKQNEKLV